jgi:hypothetical protein
MSATRKKRDVLWYFPFSTILASVACHRFYVQRVVSLPLRNTRKERTNRYRRPNNRPVERQPPRLVPLNLAEPLPFTSKLPEKVSRPACTTRGNHLCRQSVVSQASHCARKNEYVSASRRVYVDLPHPFRVSPSLTRMLLTRNGLISIVTLGRRGREMKGVRYSAKSPMVCRRPLQVPM